MRNQRTVLRMRAPSRWNQYVTASSSRTSSQRQPVSSRTSRSAASALVSPVHQRALRQRPHGAVAEVARADQEHPAVLVHDEAAGGEFEDRTRLGHTVMIRLVESAGVLAGAGGGARRSRRAAARRPDGPRACRRGSTSIGGWSARRTGRRGGIRVDIELGHEHAPRVVARERVDGGSQHVAGSAPVGPAVEQDGRRGAQHPLLEVRVRHRDGSAAAAGGARPCTCRTARAGSPLASGITIDRAARRTAHLSHAFSVDAVAGRSTSSRTSPTAPSRAPSRCALLDALATRSPSARRTATPRASS